MRNWQINRRHALTTISAGAITLASARKVFAGSSAKIVGIGACDWSLRKSGQLEALQVAKEIGLDGVEVSFGRPGQGNDLRNPEVQKQYLQLSEKLGVRICSLAMGILNSVPFATVPETEQWVEDCIEVMAAMKVKVVLLAFFGRGNLKNKPDWQDMVIQKLKRLAPKAEKADVILGIESTLNADEHIRIVDSVGSPAVQVYYDVANMHYAGYDIYKEIRQLGKDRICQIHCKERGTLLGKGEIDFRKVKEALDDIGWTGWLIIESAVDRNLGLVDSYKANAKLLRSIFAA